MYYPSNKGRFLRLLPFARISNTFEGQKPSVKDNTLLVDELNSLGEYINPAVRLILPLLYRKVSQTELRNHLLPNVQTLLKNTTILLVATQIRNQQWLLNHLEVFIKEKIPIMLLKGAAFSNSIYPENAPRLGADLDLLVTRRDFEPACALLSKTMKPVLLDSKRVATHETLFERVFVPQNGTGPIVEIHRGLTNPSIFIINEQKLWSDSRQHPAYNSELVRILSPEDTLLHLAVHAFRDLDFCTHNLLDAHEVWCQWKPDNEKLAERAKEWGARKVLYYLLANCKAIMETPVPTSLMESLRPSHGVNLINASILKSKTLASPAHNTFSYRLLQLCSQVTFTDRIIHGLKFQLSYVAIRIKDMLKQ